MSDEKCPIWGTELRAWGGGGAGQFVDSPRAGGRYEIARSVPSMLSDKRDDFRARLTTWLIDQRRLGVDTPLVTTYTLDEVERRSRLSITKRADRLLAGISRLQGHIGDLIKIRLEHQSLENDAELKMLAWSESVSESELLFLLDYLFERNWLYGSNLSTKDSRAFKVTVDGYIHLTEIERHSVASDQGFVAMWFDKSMQEAYSHGIEPAIADSGYKALIINKKEHVNKIDDEIISEIRRSRFVVADFTCGKDGARGGVYYEAGFAYGLDLPVFCSCHKDALKRLHFDTRQYNHVVWKTPDDLRQQLSARITAVIGDGPLKAVRTG